MVTAATPRMLDASEFADLYQRVSNWGRWGADDQRGTLNLLGPAERITAARLVSDGETVSCALPLNTTGDAVNRSPVLHHMLRTSDWGDELSSTADFVGIAHHGLAHTHIDAMCHIPWQGKLYNGFPVSKVTSRGALADGIEVAEQGILGRGVLLDVPMVRGETWLEPDDTISSADLDAAERAAGVQVRAGDVLLIRTGRHQRAREVGAWDARERLAGLHPECAVWLRDRGVALLGCDGITDRRPGWCSAPSLPLHVLTLNAMGLMLLDNCDFDALQQACARRGRYEFLLTVAPLRLQGGTGCAVNPIATF